jgi:hypothetical protein
MQNGHIVIDANTLFAPANVPGAWFGTNDIQTIQSTINTNKKYNEYLFLKGFDASSSEKYYWTATPSDTKKGSAYALEIDEDDFRVKSTVRVGTCAVRCISDTK